MDISFFNLEKALENLDIEAAEKELADKYNIHKLRLANGKEVYGWSPVKRQYKKEI